MFIVSGNDIQLTRGDTARLNVEITNTLNNNIYQLNEDDELILTVKKNTTRKESLIQKKSVSGDFYFAPEDTAELPYSKYVYDVQLTTHSGDVYTVIGPSVFEVMPEVTF